MKYLILFFWAIFSLGCKAQQLPEQVYQKTVPNSLPKAEYVLVGDTTQQRPLLVYCTGSLAVPLFEEENGKVYCSLPFNYRKYMDQFHLLVISKIGVPVIAETANLDRNHVFVDPETKLPPKAFLQNNTVDAYLKAYRAAIGSVKEKSWVQKDQILVMGHSGGARLAAKVAADVPGVSHLCYLSAEPQGRMLEMLAREPMRSKDRSGTLLEWLDFWKEVNASPNQIDEPQGDSYATWYSNSENVVDDLLEMEIPIFAAMGTHDPKVEGMIVIPYEFIRAGKENLTFVPYEGLEHSFFALKEDGRINYDAYHFQDVFEDVLGWWLTGKTKFDTHLTE